MVNGVNQCESLPTVYQVVSVRAYVYEEGSYTLKLVDRYGNYSSDFRELVVDNVAFMDNEEKNNPTGVG